jgi:hypothetical protein
MSILVVEADQANRTSLRYTLDSDTLSPHPLLYLAALPLSLVHFKKESNASPERPLDPGLLCSRTLLYLQDEDALLLLLA